MATEAVAAGPMELHGSIGQVCHADQKLLQDRRPGKLYDDFWYAFSCKEWIGIIDMRCHL